MKTVLCETDDGARLLLVIHHLVVDGLSWRVLIEDLNQAYEQQVTGKSLCLPPKSHAFKRWAEWLQAYSVSEQLLAEKAFWRSVEQARTVSPPMDAQALEHGAARGVATCALTREETAALLTRAVPAHQASVHDLCLTALASAMQAWYGANATLIWLEGHGREWLPSCATSGASPDMTSVGTLDVSRTVGWFTSLYPVVLALPDSEDPGDQIRHVKALLGTIPHKGLGYGILKYITPQEKKTDLTFQATPRVLFNYLGEFATAESDQWFVMADERAGNPAAPHWQSVAEMDIEAVVVRGTLEIAVTFQQRAFHQETWGDRVVLYNEFLFWQVVRRAFRMVP